MTDPSCCPLVGPINGQRAKNGTPSVGPARARPPVDGTATNATGTVNGAGRVRDLGLAKAFHLGGCGGAAKHRYQTHLWSRVTPFEWGRTLYPSTAGSRRCPLGR